MQRNREQTRAAILKAVGQLLARSGFSGVGVNAIAREAGVDKVLIYRYFGGLPELLKAFAAETDFWPDLPKVVTKVGKPTATSDAELAKQMLLEFARALRERPLTQEIMRWELLERNELADALASFREDANSKLILHFEERVDIDIRAIASLLAAGLTYLILRSKTADVYNGLSLKSEQDWLRMERAAEFLIDVAFAKGRAAKCEVPVEPARKPPKVNTHVRALKKTKS